MRISTLDNRLEHVGLIGAGGKMGRGIALLLLREMALTDRLLKRPQPSRLWLIDQSADALLSLRTYLEQQNLKFAERNTRRCCDTRGWFTSSRSVSS